MLAKDENNSSQLHIIPDKLKAKKILIVDDVELNQLVISELLSSNGFKNLLTAADGREALIKTKEYKPDLVILDLIMPDVDGFQYLTEVRSDPKFTLLPIVVQTITSDPHNKAKAFACGATDFVTKPIDQDELIARTLVHLERQQLYDDLLLTKNKMDEELLEAKKLQDAILPNSSQITLFEDKYQVEVKSFFKTSSQLGGDFWGITPITDKKFAIFNIDFSGHGVSAAINISRLHTIMNEIKDQVADPATYLEILNKKVCNVINRGTYATMFYGVVDLDQDLLTYASAACPEPFIITKNKQIIETLSGKGFPIGSFKEATYKNLTAQFPQGSLLMLYSDALIETEGKNGKFWDNLDIIRTIENSWNQASNHGKGEKIYEAITEKFNNDYKDQLHDDLTLALFFRYF